MTNRIDELFRDAHAEGELSAEGLQVLTVGAEIAAQVESGLGVPPDDVPQSEVVLLTQMPDDSGSIRFAGNAEAVRSGHNQVLEALLASKQKDQVLAHTRYLNGQVLFPYRPLRDAVRMTARNYDPCQGTPLFDQCVVLLGTVLAKTREFEAAGVPVRSISLLITDGADEHSTSHDARAVRALVRDLLQAEKHIVAGLGLSNASTDFRAVFQDLGIPDSWILTPASSQGEVRRAFRAFSQSALRASAGGAAFAQAAAGGFGS